MSDVVDDANDHLEKSLALLLKLRKREGPQPTGLCLWCGENVAPLKRWCDKDCLNDCEHNQRK